MPFAAFVQVEIDPASTVDHRRSILNELVAPPLSQLDGFSNACWLHDGNGVATCIAVFETREQATRALTVVAPSNGPRILGATVCEVDLQV